MKRKLLFAIVALLCSVASWAQRDITSTYITNATLSNGTTGWTVSNFNAPVGGNGNNDSKGVDGIKYGNNPTNSVNVTGAASECYAGWATLEKSSYSMKQSVTLPQGSYRLVCYAFYREGEVYNTDVNTSRARLFAGTKAETNIKTLGSITAGGYANSQQAGAICFDTKMYRNEIEFTVGEGGETFDIGVEGTFTVQRSWCILGMFELFDMNDLASVSSPTDMTYAITNPGFEFRSLGGWTNGSGDTYAITNTEAFGNRAGIYWVEKWQSGSGLGTQSDFKQTLSNMPAGLYELSVYAHNVEQYNSDAAGTGMYVIANSDQTEIGAAGQYKVRTTLASDGDLTVGIKLDNCTGSWIAFDRFELKFFGDPLEAYKDLLADAVAAAQALIDGSAGDAISSTAKAAWQAVVNANDNDDNAFTEESQFTTAIENINNANTNYQAMAAPYASFNALKTAADAIAAVEYTETTSGSHSTFATAISDQNTAANAALTASAINTATSTLKSAIKTYINGAEPKNEGESFEITCLIENPSFNDNTISGWTRTYTGGSVNTSFTNNEFFNNTFDFYQDLTGLANGSYQLSVQAYSRPGDNGDLTDNKKAYYNYTQGVNDVTAELYVNSDASKVGNIYAYTEATTIKHKPGTWANDYECVVDDGTNYFVPNSMEGASKYFADENVYKTTVAALVEDGNLRIGFRDETLTANQWTIFDNFRLYYYGSSKLIYYQQYLPQLRTEVSADLANGAYTNVLVSSEDEALDAALVADPASETEEAYETVINALRTAQTNFRAAATSYDAMVAAKAYTALTKASANIGTGVFQYNETTNNTLYSAYETAKSAVDGYTFTTSSTAAGAQALVDALNDATGGYNNQALNAPSSSTRYKLVLADKGALTFQTASTEGGYGMPFKTAADYMAQTFTFTPVESETNTYTLSFEDFDGNTRYVCTRAQYGEGGTGVAGIRTFANDNKKEALKIKVQAASTDNVFYMLNTESSDAKLGSNGGDFYTDPTYSNWSIAEATQASVTVSAKAGKYGTVIFPFTPDVSTGFDGITFYSCTEVSDDKVQMEEVVTPAANTPYIIKNANGTDFSKALTGWGTATADSDNEGLLTGVYTAKTIAQNANNYVLQTPTSGEDEGKQAFYLVSGDFTATAYKCYLTYAAPSPVKALFFDFGDETGVNAVDNGQLATDNAAIYNLAGQRVSKAQKGLYIQNGRKFIVK